MGKAQNFRIIILTLLLLLVCLTVALMIHKMFANYRYGQFGTHDFVQYWTAGQFFLDGKNPFDWDANFTLQKALGWTGSFPIVMKNPPLLLAWFYPLLLLPFGGAAFIWCLLSALLILFCGTVSWNLGDPNKSLRNIILAQIFTISFAPVFFVTLQGQSSTLVLVGVTGFLFFLTKQRYFLAGLFMGLTAVKPHQAYLLWVLFGFIIIRQRNIRLLAGVLVSIFIPLLFVVIHSPDIMAQYVERMVSPQTEIAWLCPTIGSFLYSYTYQSPYIKFLPSLAATIGFLIFLSKRPSLTDPSLAHYAILISLPTSPYGSWTSDMVILLIPYLWIISRLYDRGISVVLWTICLLSVSGAMMLQYYLRIPEPYFIWVSFAIAFVYFVNVKKQRLR